MGQIKQPRSPELDGFTDYLEAAGLADSSVKLYERIARRSLPDPIAWVQREVTATTPEGTALSYAAAIRHLLAFQGVAEPEGLLPRLRKRQLDFRNALTDSELAAWRDAVAPVWEPFRTILLLLPLTGLRIAEACGLPRRALVTEGRVIGFKVIGKGDKERFVPLGPAALALLKTYSKTTPRGASEWLFPSPQSGERSVTPGAVRRHLNAVKKALPGVASEATPHVLRHTFATNVLARGGNLKEVADLLGHSSTHTTERYLHPSADRLATLVDDL